MPTHQFQVHPLQRRQVGARQRQTYAENKAKNKLSKKFNAFDLV